MRQALIQRRVHLLVVERIAVDLVDAAKDPRRGDVRHSSAR
jgi:hypothetical protein